MSAIDPGRFDEYFRALNPGQEPFPWQSRLARRVLAETARPWPDVIAAPTASGKTACIDIALFALAAQAHRPPAERTAPRRLFFVVDRRVVVDEAFDRAARIRASLAEARDGILREVADALRQVAQVEPDEDPLQCVLLRGGVFRDEAWTTNPLQPTVIASTVDQVGSRLLFRGYGLTRFARPIHAALTANDALILLDEAHCANPFQQTISAIHRYRAWAGRTVGGPLHVVRMSATPVPGDSPLDRFELEDEDRDPRSELGRRLAAAKPAELVEVPTRRGVSGDAQFADALASKAQELAGERAVVAAVIVNRVRLARLVAERLASGGRGAVRLVIGSMRPLDRDDVIREIQQAARSGGARALGAPFFVVATQCLEVGADLDFDVLVTECASLDALRQRFGRLNRLGRASEARAPILMRSDAVDDLADPIYGRAIAETWRWLNEEASSGAVDCGVTAMDRRVAAATAADPVFLRRVVAAEPDAPVLMPSHLDLLVQTDPEPAPTPDVAVFLHGSERADPDVQLCWRADLDEAPLEQWADIVALCPPAAPECMPVPLSQVRRWLAGDDLGVDGADVEGLAAAVDGAEQGQPAGVERRGLRWRGAGDEETVLVGAGLPARVAPGDVLVVPAALAPWRVLGAKPPEAPEDRAEEAALRAGRGAIVRLHPGIVKGWPDALRARAEELARREDLDPEEALAALREGRGNAPAWLVAVLSAMEQATRPTAVGYPGGQGYVLSARLRPPRRRASGMDLGFAPDSDESSAGSRVTLAEHTEDVQRVAAVLVRGVGLDDRLCGVVDWAAGFHDVGKADPRFQALLRGGSLLEALVDGEVLAKSERVAAAEAERRDAARRSGYPRGARHELLSVRLVESSPDAFAGVDDVELMLHLIASHHGRCRPFAPSVEDANPQEVVVMVKGVRLRASSRTELERVDSGVADRFWRVVRRYGWWGSAWLEALLRLADQQASCRERERDTVRELVVTA